MRPTSGWSPLDSFSYFFCRFSDNEHYWETLCSDQEPTRLVQRHSTSASVETTSSGTHRCSLIHTKLGRRCVQAGFRNRRSTSLKQHKHCIVSFRCLIPGRRDTPPQTPHPPPWMWKCPPEFQGLYSIKVNISTPKPDWCRSSDVVLLQKTESLLYLLSSLYLSVICLCLNRTQLLSVSFFLKKRTLDNLIPVQQQQQQQPQPLWPLWPFLVSCCVAHRCGADVEPALHGRLEPQWPCVLSKLGSVGHMVGLRLLHLGRHGKRSWKTRQTIL